MSIETRSFVTSPSIIKLRVMEWLASQPGDPPSVGTEDLAQAVQASVGATNAALWSLKRGGYITFRERKGSGHGHGSGTSYADRVHFTDQGRVAWESWGPDVRRQAEYIEGTIMQAPDDIKEVTGDLIVEKLSVEVPPAPEGSYRADALAWWLKHRPDRKGTVRAYNEWAGLRDGAVQVYQLVERNPEAFALVEPKGTVAFVGSDDWSFRPKPTRPIDPAADPANVIPHTTQKAELGPQLEELLGRADRRRKVEEAIVLLSAAGLDEDALPLLDRIPSDSPLEVEVLALLRSLGH